MLELIKETTPVETRFLALDDQERPVSLHIFRPPSIDARVKWGEVHPCVLTRIDYAQSAAFVAFASGETGYFNLQKGRKPPPEGAKLNVEIVSESWAEKSARVKPSEHPVSLLTQNDDFETWCSSLGQADVRLSERPFAEQCAIIDFALEEVLSETITVRGGGAIHLEQTRAFLSVDVDSNGRDLKKAGGSINADALDELARQIVLRRSGGLIVVDLVGAPKGQKADALRARFQSALQSSVRSGNEVLPISRLGLLEVSLRRRYRPLSDLFCAERQQDTIRERLITCFVDLTRRAHLCRTDVFEIWLGGLLYETFRALDIDVISTLSETYGSRFSVEKRSELNAETYKIITK